MVSHKRAILPDIYRTTHTKSYINAREASEALHFAQTVVVLGRYSYKCSLKNYQLSISVTEVLHQNGAKDGIETSML